ncbi:MAG TPA: DUF2298 domain-containing protein, partial [Anaerolineae bacterium]|nr:DUF2298 domain-containing protein [Anaerolineae bacterium]
DIWQPWNGGEKFMEFAFLNAILRSPYFPPLDPYFAGGVINYYYYGHYLVAVLVKLTGIASSVAFNLAIPTVFALAVVNVWSLAYNLALRLWPAASPSQTVTNHPVTQSPSPSGMVPNHPITQSPSHLVTSRPAALTALLAAFFVAMLGNVDGGSQIVRQLAALSNSSFESNLPGVQTAVRAVGGLAKVIGHERLPGYSYWDPSRVIPNTINEFPYWSFLFADLHPHMIGIGFTVLFLALALGLLLRNGERHVPDMADGWRIWTGYVVRAATGDGLYVVLALTLGALAVINTWDLPTYFGLAVLIWLMREWRTGRLTTAPLQALVRTALFSLGLLGMALLFYLPFFANYHALASSGVGLTPQASEPGKWLNMWGFLGFMAVSFVLVELRRRGSRYGAEGSRYGADAYSTGGSVVRDPAILRWLRLAMDHFSGLARLVQWTPRVSANSLLTIGVAAAAAVALIIVDRAVAGVLLLPLLAAFLLLWRRTVPAETLFVTALVFTGLLVLFGVEIFYLKDHLQGGDWRRMNTLFKFYIQVWVLLALAAAVALPGIWDFIRRRWRPVWRVLWAVVFVYLLGLSLVFLVAGTPARLADRFPAGSSDPNRPSLGTLDGMAYMQAGTYTWHPDPAQAPTTRIELSHDYDALRWMLDTIEGTPVVAEALIGYYREGGLRVASFTGFPTLLGFHQEGEQRYGWQTGPRRSQAEAFWNTTDVTQTQQLMAELGIDYIYLGQLERIVYPAESLAKFEQMAADGLLDVVYSNDQVVVYRVVK